MLMGAAQVGLAYFTPRTQFGQLVALFGTGLLAYGWLLRSGLGWRWDDRS